MASRIGKQTVVIVSVQTDRFGDRIDAGRMTVPGCLIQPTSQSEGLAVGRDQPRSQFIVFGPAALASASAGTVLEVPGTVIGSTAPTARLETLGDAAVWVGTDGKVDHVEVLAIRTTG